MGVRDWFGSAARWCAILPAALGAAAAHAACPATNQYNFTFSSKAAASLSYASSYTYTGTSTTLGNQNFTVDFITNGVASNVVAGEAMPAITGLITDGVAARNLMIGGTFTGRTADVSVNTRVVVARLTFTAPIRDLTIQLNDIDFTANQFRDWLQVNGILAAASYDPALATPHGANNGAGPRTSVNSSMTLGPATLPFPVTVRQGLGVSSSGNNANTGTVTASFEQPVSQVEIRYGNYNDGGATGQQGIGIQSLSWCPMPGISMTKTQAPLTAVATDPNRFDIPGSDSVYSLTVSNTNSSPVDAASLVLTDPLPGAMTFYNGDIDDAGPLTTNYEFVPGTSGLTLASGNVSYSNNGGTTYAYTPAAGYDAAVNAVRINPQGIMAANSSFTVRFRTRIK